MELYLFLTVCLAASALTQGYHSGGIGGDVGGWGGGHHNGGWGGGMTVSKRAAGASGIYEQVRATLDKATGGITADELEAAAAAIQSSADAYVDANGGTVPAQDIQAVIDEVASTFNGAVAVSALFDTQLTFEASLLDAALCLWDGLVDKAQQLEAAGESPIAAIAAISMTATSIQEITVNTVGTIIHLHLETQEGVDVPPEEAGKTKRWKVEGEVKHDSGGTSGGVKVSHSWKRNPIAKAVSEEEDEDNLAKRRWGGHRDGPSGGGSASRGWTSRSAEEKRDEDSLSKRGGWPSDRPGGGRPGGDRPGGGRPGGWRKRTVASSDDATEQDDLDKRIWNGGNHDRPGGGGGIGGGGIGGGGGGWRGRDAEDKRGKWSGSLSGGYSSSGGANVGASVSYSWRRR